MKKFITVSTTALATVGAIVAAAAFLYKTGHLSIEIEKDEPKDKEDSKKEAAEAQPEVKPKKGLFRARH